MPTITQEGGKATIKGLPIRWGVRAYKQLTAARGVNLGIVPQEYKALCAVIDRIIGGPLAIDATDAQLCIIAEQTAVRCLTPCHGRGVVPWASEAIALINKCQRICQSLGIVAPAFDDEKQNLLRMQDAAWWSRQIRKAHARAFEAAAVALGFVSRTQGAYCSDEAAARRVVQVARNKKALQAVGMVNEDGQVFKLSELADKGIGNKAKRRGELMLRMSGCETIAKELEHVGVFVTQTCPSKYHAILSRSGAANPKNKGENPRDAQAYLMQTWALSRAEFGRQEIRPYGFRIAEPHHDGCVHWHSLVFMPAGQVAQFKAIMTGYALAESGEEVGKNVSVRIKFVDIDPAKGGAAAYIAKYILKNMDDESGEMLDEVDGIEYTIKKRGAITPAQRVDAWAGVWGIRQFQPIGQPPVTVWREVRRVPAAAVVNAAPQVRAAWDAAQRVQAINATTDEITVTHAASFAEFIRAMGGVCLGRNYTIAIREEEKTIAGRYGVFSGWVPKGIYVRAAPERLYESVRYVWTRKDYREDIKTSWKATQEAASRVFDLPWSPVNNCTKSVWYSNAPTINEESVFQDREHFTDDRDKYDLIEPVDLWAMYDAAVIQAQATAKDGPQYDFAHKNPIGTKRKEKHA